MENEMTMTANSQITDVTQFFHAITEEYEYFERDILQVIDKIPDCSPPQIVAQCNKLGEQRNKLAVMDEQMFSIIELAGSEIAKSPMVSAYRVAFARANMACNNLYQKLQDLRASI